MMRIRKTVVFFIAISAIIPLLAFAQQDIERATKEVDRSLRKEVEDALVGPPKGEREIEEVEKAKEVEGPTFFIKKINLTGYESFSLEEFQSLVQQYENRDLSFDELRILTKRIERFYLKRGIIAACVIPPQEIKEGVAVLQIVEARMGDLTVEPHKHFNKKRVGYYWELKPGEILKQYKISRSLQLMNETPDRQVKATLYAGKKPGTTDVLLQVKTYFPLHFTYTLDNEGGITSGVYRKGVGIRHNNFLGLDDILFAGYSFGDHFRTIYAYHSLPITSFGTSFMYGFARSEAFPKKDYEVNDIRSYGKDGSAFIYQDIFKKDEFLGECYIGVSGGDKVVYTNTGVNSKDRLRTLRLGGRFIVTGNVSRTNIDPEFAQGLNLLGARATDLSSRTAGNTFSKLALGLQHTIGLPPATQLNLKAHAQIPSEKLPPQEQLSLGGIDSIRGYPSGDFFADIGIRTNTELTVQPIFLPDTIKLPYAARPLKEDISGVLFFDYGCGARRGQREGEKDFMRLGSLGFGLNISLFDQALLRLEWGYPLQIFDSPVAETARSRFHLSLAYEDRIDQEFERIGEIIREDHYKQWAWNILYAEFKRPGSYLRQRLYGYLYMAEVARKEGDIEKARGYYRKILGASTSLYAQAFRYVKNCINQKETLEKYTAIAKGYYRKGNYKKAKELYQKIVEAAKIKPLILTL